MQLIQAMDRSLVTPARSESGFPGPLALPTLPVDISSTILSGGFQAVCAGVCFTFQTLKTASLLCQMQQNVVCSMRLCLGRSVPSREHAVQACHYCWLRFLACILMAAASNLYRDFLLCTAASAGSACCDERL